MISDTFKCRCKCYEKCEPKCKCECNPKHDCEWFEKLLKESYWRGFNDGCRKCRRKEHECDKYEYEGCEEYEVYDAYER